MHLKTLSINFIALDRLTLRQLILLMSRHLLCDKNKWLSQSLHTIPCDNLKNIAMHSMMFF